MRSKNYKETIQSTNNNFSNPLYHNFNLKLQLYRITQNPERPQSDTEQGNLATVPQSQQQCSKLLGIHRPHPCRRQSKSTLEGVSKYHKFKPPHSKQCKLIHGH